MNAAVAQTALIELQRRFFARMRGLSGNDPAGDLDAMIARGRMSPEVGLKIYAHAYGARLRETIEHDHAVLGTYLGDDLWERMCQGYIAAHPSHYRSLRDFGADLPDYLAWAETFEAHPQIAELARFERCLLDSFDAADDAHASWDQLQALPASRWPTLRLRFHPSLRLHHVEFNSIEIWQAIKAGHEPPPAGIASSNQWVLWRDPARISRFRSLDAQEHGIVAHCLQGGDFSGLCELLTGWHDAETVPALAIAQLQTWCSDGWISQWR